MSHVEHEHAARDHEVRCAVITCSDTRTEEDDASGNLLCQLLRKDGLVVSSRRIVPDDPIRISEAFDEACAVADAVLMTGGTGIGRRDGTVEVVSDRLEKTLPGFGELFRMLSFEEIGAAAMLSRAVAGTYCGAVVFALPGSTPAVRLAAERLILPQLRHLVRELRR